MTEPAWDWTRCPNCGRTEEVVLITRHHLAVRSRVRGRDKGPVMPLCEDCHRQLNALYDERTQATLLGTAAALLEDAAMEKFGRWASRQRKRVKKRQSKERRRR